jgi:hypothetical protein
LTFFDTIHLGRAIWLLCLSALLFLLPGGVLLAWLSPRRLKSGGPECSESWIDRLIVAAGLSVAVNALLVYATLTGLRLNSAVVIGYLALCGAGILLRWALDGRANGWRAIRWNASGRIWSAGRALSAGHILPAVALLATTVLILVVRLYVVRDLAVPMWGDSYQHTMMSQLIVDNGGLFDSWEPYVPLRTFTYHFGLHANVALYHWLSHLDAPGMSLIRSMTWVGQILNVLAVLVLYPLAVKVSGNRWAGVAAVWIAGLFLPMPMYYVNWGRYTQLAGQVILPAVVVLSWSLFEAPTETLEHRGDERPGRWRLYAGRVLSARRWIPAWIGIAGLALTHYRVLLFYGAFVAAWLLLDLGRATADGEPARRDSWWRARRDSWGRALWLGAGSFVLVLPWFVRTLGGKIVDIVTYQLTTAPARLSSFSVQYNAIGNLSTFMAPVWWLLLPVAAAAGLWRRKRGVLVFSVWWFLLYVGTNPQALRLPGSGVITNFALFIAVYILAGILIGDLFGWLVDRLGGCERFLKHGRFLKRGGQVLLVLLLIGVGVRGAYLRTRDLHVQQHALALQPDVEAMAWIRENTPADARFLVNSFFAYGESVIVGSDGGWWMPLLAGRVNTVPPLNYSAEQGPWPEYRLWVNELTALIQDRGIDDPATIGELRERGITHVYIGQQQGRVNYGGPHVLSPDVLRDSPSYRPIYHQDQVWVFELMDE